MRQILQSSLQGERLLVVTGKEERADAVLRGGAEDLVFSEVNNSADGVNAHVNAGRESAGRSVRRAALNGGLSLEENDSSHSSDRRHEAIAAVRLVNQEGDVIWATTQESLGAKFRGASVDVAEKITAKLKEDFETAKGLK